MHIRNLSFAGKYNNATIADPSNPYNISMDGYENDLWGRVSYSDIVMDASFFNDATLIGDYNVLDMYGPDNRSYMSGNDNTVTVDGGGWNIADFFGDWNSYYSYGGFNSVYAQGESFYARFGNGNNDVMVKGNDAYVRGGDNSDHARIKGDGAWLNLRGGDNTATIDGSDFYYRGGNGPDEVLADGDDGRIRAYGGKNHIEVDGNDNEIEVGAVDEDGEFILNDDSRHTVLVGGYNNELQIGSGNAKVFLMPGSEWTQIDAHGNGDTTVFLMPKAGTFDVDTFGSGKVNIINLAADFDSDLLAQAFTAGKGGGWHYNGGEKGGVPVFGTSAFDTPMFMPALIGGSPEGGGHIV